MTRTHNKSKNFYWRRFKHDTPQRVTWKHASKIGRDMIIMAT